MLMRNYVIASMLLLLMMFLGCSHPLTLTNRDQYFCTATYIDKKIVVGIVPASSPDAEPLIESIVENMRSMGEIKVIYPYNRSANNPVDYILDYNIMTQYSGDGTNFFVAFPGFLIFAPWWNGYYYNMDLQTKMNMTDYKSNQPVKTDTYSTMYTCQHSSFDRTWTQGTDWLLTYGACSLIGGFYFTTYDSDITGDFTRNVSQPYGQYIARKSASTIKSMMP